MSALSEVKMILDGESIVLRPTLRAAKEVNAFFGAFSKVYERLATFDLDAFIAMTAIGTGKKPKDVEDAVFRTGLPDLLLPLTQFCTLLANGGRLPAETKPAEGEAKPGES